MVCALLDCHFLPFLKFVSGYRKFFCCLICCFFQVVFRFFPLVETCTCVFLLSRPELRVCPSARLNYCALKSLPSTTARSKLHEATMTPGSGRTPVGQARWAQSTQPAESAHHAHNSIRPVVEDAPGKACTLVC